MTAPKRIQLRRTKGWRKPEGAVVVARPTKWGNPFTAPTDPRLAVETFRSWLTCCGPWSVQLGNSLGMAFVPEWDHSDALLAALPELSGHDLACWCPLDQPCHADVLLELANGSAS